VSHPRRTLHLYWAVVGLYLLVLGWWMYFFTRQGEFLARRIEAAGVALSPEQAAALRDAARQSMRMFLFEGVFLGLMLLAGVYLVVRSMQREIAVHRQQRNFLSAVTHELRSPIASARLYLESLRLGRAEGEKRERYLRHAQEDLDRLRLVVDQLLESARLSSAGPALRPEHVDLAAFAAASLEELARDPSTRAAEVTLRAPEPVHVVGDASALGTILRNLLSNAVKYGGSPARVEISVSRNGAHALLSVRDFGPGLQGLDSQRIFEPFVRGGDESVRTRPGVGLGLFMVAELARALGGGARARDAEPGLAVEVSLPLSPKEA
jgi:signal transduction histidine kinase